MLAGSDAARESDFVLDTCATALVLGLSMIPMFTYISYDTSYEYNKGTLYGCYAHSCRQSNAVFELYKVVNVHRSDSVMNKCLSHEHF